MTKVICVLLFFGIQKALKMLSKLFIDYSTRNEAKSCLKIIVGLGTISYAKIKSSVTEQLNYIVSN